MRAFGWMAAMVVLASLVPVAARSACTVGRLAELPVTMIGEKATAPVKINGRPAQIAIDSGAAFSILPRAVAVDNGLSIYAAPFNLRMSGVNGDIDVSVAKVRTFTLAGVDLSNIEFLVGGSSLDGLAGLLGQNVLHIADVEYDFANGALRIMRPRGCGEANLAYWAAGKPVSTLAVQAGRGANQQVSGVVTVNGVRLRAVFDTGADSSVLTLAGAGRGSTSTRPTWCRRGAVGVWAAAG